MKKEKKIENDNDPIKIILVGESGVGKTNLINVFLGNKFEEQYSTLSSSSFEGEIDYNNKSYKYFIWDTAGQEKFRSVNKIFFRDAKIILVVYAIDDINSFNNVDFWINYVKENIETDKYILELVENKNDLFDSRMVMEEDATAAEKKYGIKLYSTSALTEAEEFQNHVNNLIKDYIKKYLEKGNINDKKSVKIKKVKKKKKKSC